MKQLVANLRILVQRTSKPPIDAAERQKGDPLFFDDRHTETLFWESAGPNLWLVEKLLWVLQLVIGRPWQWLNLGRYWLRQRFPLAALGIDFIAIVLIAGGLWFLVRERVESTPRFEDAPQGIPADTPPAPTRVPLIYDSTPFCPSKPVDEPAISRFTVDFPHIEIRRRCLGSFFYRIEKDFASPNPPHFSKLFAGYNVQNLAAQGLLLDLSDLWEQEGWNDAFPQWLQRQSSVHRKERSLFITPQKPTARLQTSNLKEGQKYFLPTAYSWSAIYYSKPIFERYHLTAPNTWDELLDTAEILKQHNIRPMAIPDETIWFDYLNMRLNGPEFHRDLLWGEVNFEDQRVKYIFEIWQNLLAQEFFHTETTSDDFGYSQAILAMHREEAAMALGDSFFFRDAIPEKFQDNFGFFPMPIIDETISVGENVTVFGYVIPGKAQEQEISRKLLIYLGSAEAQAYLAAVPGLVPTRSDIDPNLLSAEAKQGKRLIQKADAIGPPYTPSVPRLMTRRGSRAFRLFLKNFSDIETILTTLEEARQEALAEKGL